MRPKCDGDCESEKKKEKKMELEGKAKASHPSFHMPRSAVTSQAAGAASKPIHPSLTFFSELPPRKKKEGRKKARKKKKEHGALAQLAATALGPSKRLDKYSGPRGRATRALESQTDGHEGAGGGQAKSQVFRHVLVSRGVALAYFFFGGIFAGCATGPTVPSGLLVEGGT